MPGRQAAACLAVEEIPRSGDLVRNRALRSATSRGYEVFRGPTPNPYNVFKTHIGARVPFKCSPLANRDSISEHRIDGQATAANIRIREVKQ